MHSLSESAILKQFKIRRGGQEEYSVLLYIEPYEIFYFIAVQCIQPCRPEPVGQLVEYNIIYRCIKVKAASWPSPVDWDKIYFIYLKYLNVSTYS